MDTIMFRSTFVLLMAGLVSVRSWTEIAASNATSEDGGPSAAAANSTTPLSSLPSCTEVQQIFVMKQIGPAQLVPSHMISGADLELCPSSRTCCSSKMEDRYKEVVKKDFRIMLQTTSSYLKTLLATTATKFKENFIEMIQVSENNTNILFSDVYQKMDTAARVPVSQLYADLTAYVSGRDLDLDARVAGFFDSLFPLVYHHSINPKLKDFSENYKECLRETQREIQPFGEIPRKVALQLSRSLGAARTLVQALSLGVEVINTTEFLDFGPDCNRALVKLTYCAHCQAMVVVRPCSGYCLNVVRGCLASVAELDQPWSDFLTALQRLTAGMVGSYNIEEMLSVLDTKISEAIMHAMENGPEISKRVKMVCGHPRRATRETPAEDTASKSTAASPSAGKIVSVRSAETSLYVRLQHFVRRLAESKGVYANLADTMCNEESLAVRGEAHCWNGNTLGEYTKTIAGIGIPAQKNNPEMKSPKSRDPSVATLIDKLRHIKQILYSKVTSVPESDSQTVDGSGSGSDAWDSPYNSRHDNFPDDEDFEEGSGGSGDRPGTTDDFQFDPTTDGNKPKGGDGASLTVSSFSGVTLLLSSMFLGWCNARRMWCHITH